MTEYHIDNLSRNGTIRKNIYGSIILKAISILTSLILVPLTLEYVSKDVYGLWLTLSSIIIWLGFLDIGFSLGLKNKLAEAISLNNWETGKKLVSTTYALMFCIFVPVGIIAELAIPLIDWSKILNISSTYVFEIKLSMHFIIGSFCIQMIANVLTIVLSALQRVALSSFFGVLGNIFSLIAIYILIHTSPSSLSLLSLVLSSIPVIILIISSFYFYHNKLHKLSPHIKYVDIKYVKELFSLGYKFFILQIQVLVVGQTTNFLISYISGPSDVTYFNIAYRYLGIATMVFAIILGPLWPAFTEAYTKKDYSWMTKAYSKLTKICLLTEFCIILMVVISPIAYNIWLGDNVTIPWSMTLLVSFYFMVQVWASLNINLINGIGCIQLQTYFAIFVSIIHIPISLITGKYIGGLGVIVSLILFNAIYAIFSTIQMKKLLSQKATGIWVK